MNRKPFVLLETLTEKRSATSYCFSDFTTILTAQRGDDPRLFLRKLQKYLERGYWACGFFTYEFGYSLEQKLRSLSRPARQPLAWFGIAERPRTVAPYADIAACCGPVKAYAVDNVRADTRFPEYARAIAKIKRYLRRGDTYQVNFTFKIEFDFAGDPCGLYKHLRLVQPTAYTALMYTGTDYILSHSPELFFKRDRDRIVTRPMKGTTARGTTPKTDHAQGAFLTANEKNRAENVMIVDLMRNDLGRLAHRVWVPELFGIERHSTLYQMTSTVKARLTDDSTVERLMCSLFPSGSVTGAPKISTLRIIRELEKAPRGIYTGAIGYFAPDDTACFNVAIRTLHIAGNRGELGVGGGIVVDSKASDEYREAQLKAQFFVASAHAFRLIETIRYDGRAFWLLEMHLDRLAASCSYFSIPFDRNSILRRLKKLVPSGRAARVRMTIDARGSLAVETGPLGQKAVPVPLAVSGRRIDPDQPLLYHKTTMRRIYDGDRIRARREGVYEVIYVNTRGEVTEGSFSNVFIERNGMLFTPPVASGLLPGVLRRHLIECGRAREQVLYERDLYEADAVYVGNSVRGLLRGRFGPQQADAAKKLRKQKSLVQ